MSPLLGLKLAAVALALAMVAGALWWTYAEGKTAGRNEVSTRAMEKAAEKTNEGIRLRNQAARRAAGDDDDTAFERMRPRARDGAEP
jgi:hypothetical protein